MPINVDHVEDSPGFPDQVDVVVIGGGIVGTCTAYELARDGVSVALLEKGLIGAEQSSRNWGWCRQQNRALHELPLAIYSLERWGALSEELGRDVGFRRSGIVYVSDNPESLATWERWGRQARELGFVSHMLGADEARQRSPGAAGDWIGGVFSPSDGRAEPSMACPAIANGARERGARVHQNCAVRGLELSAGRIAGVWTERGLIRAATVVCAGGAWSSRFCRRHGIDLPAANILGSALRTTAAPEVTPGCLTTPELALRRRLDGGYTLAMLGHGSLDITPQSLRYATRFHAAYRSKLAKKLTLRCGRSFFSGPEAAGSWQFDQVSPFERQRILDPKPNASLIRQTMVSLRQTYPALAGVHVAQAWGGMIDTTPDIVPVMSPVESLPGLVIASGFSGHGFGLGPGAGRLVADLIGGRPPLVDPHPFRLSRFSDGSRIQQPEMM